ncbi:CaiB/BaiF CoA transferase family protein [Neoaquamicrobium sediminum]|uniref:CaiB/BaiF CoA transferase family protein n=1 Tax=Neoaquamicrobium sediminum TaxID=1849104 RepID=UPI00361F5B59
MSADHATGYGLPFEGLRVVELGNVIAGPLCGSLLADFGADIVKIERPDGGDAGRQLGLEVDGLSVWWGVGVRDKQCVTLDLKDADDRERLLTLLRDADVLIENNRPGALDRLGIGWRDLRQVNPELVMVSISGFGQTGPMAAIPGFGKIAEAFSGIVPLTGDPDDIPLHVGFSLADASASLFGLLGAATALWARDCNGAEGAQIDIALYEPLHRMVELQSAMLAEEGRVPLRNGTNNPYGWGAADDGTHLVGVSCADGTELSVLVDDEARQRLGKLVGEEGDPLSALRAWGAARSVDEAGEALRASGLEVAPVHDGLSIARDPYFRARGDVQPATLPSGRQIAVPGHVLRQLDDSGTKRSFRHAALGVDQKAVFGDERGERIDG